MQVKLLLEVLGTIVEDPLFVLKGGTAINFFHTNLPRLSVDIDLTYTKINPRKEFLNDCSNFWQALSTELPRRHKVFVQIKSTKDGIQKQMNISSENVAIKVETNLVLRGIIYPVISITSCEAIKIKYETKLNINTLAFEELYAGKFCAALDRQHPRDMFDVLIFFENHQISEKLKLAFLLYLISANRPIAELINPNRLDRKLLYTDEFRGMTNRQVSYRALTEAREMLISNIDSILNQQDREFLISFKRGEPAWEYFGIDHVKDMPAIKWKLHNIERMDPKKHILALNKLKQKLGY